MVQVVNCDLPWAIEDVLGQHGLGLLGYFVFSAHWASFNIVNDICIYAGPVYHLTGLGLLLLHLLVCTVEVSKDPVKECGEYKPWSPFSMIPSQWTAHPGYPKIAG